VPAEPPPITQTSRRITCAPAKSAVDRPADGPGDGAAVAPDDESEAATDPAAVAPINPSIRLRVIPTAVPPSVDHE
jgi:hypothetical protein